MCEQAQALAHGRFNVISFRAGLLTLAVSSSAQAADVHMQSTEIISSINQKLNQELVKKIRYKLIN